MKKEKLLENFVYLLFDPNETKPFYVGKGKNKRAEFYTYENQ